MFGIIRPCRHRLGEKLQRSWMAHLCGLCLALRDGHGQLARTATNYDGLIVSVLVEAQRPSTPDDRRTAGPCPLRGMRSASVARGEGAQLAAAVSLALASAKVRDHVDDRDGAFARRPVATAAGGMADRWRRQSLRGGAELGFDIGVLFDTLARQTALERSTGLGSSVLLVTAPTEDATALALEHTAALAGRPGNAAALREAGRYFGRLAHLLDAVEDLTEDQSTGAWNPLAATGTSLEEAERLCRDAVHGIKLALAEVEMDDRVLAHRLLVHETDAAVRRTFGHARGSYPPPQPPPGMPLPPMGPNPFGNSPFGPPIPPVPPGRRRNPLAACGIWALLCCTCQACCREDYVNPCNGRHVQGPCSDMDCGDCCDGLECCECCECCECLECCDCGGC
ncbi:hypothetical protein ABH940_001515 [Streptacidiphilus sp. BW17]|uniref:DUF5685 family protein n=1 Tax=Streptacidiphilus sp. BW17 TaxID=3156274 RepID=UPI00351293C8